MAIDFTGCAGQHGLTEADVVQAISNARYYEAEFEEPCGLSSVRPSVRIGPSLNPLAPLIEVVAEVIPPDTVRVFHAVRARTAFLARLDVEGDKQ